MERTHCKHPDHDEPRLTCGHPLPCPWHTVVVLEKDLPSFLERRWFADRIDGISYIGG